VGRLRDRCATEEEFCRALEEEFHRVAGLWGREAEIERRIEGYRHQIEELNRATEKYGRSNPHTIDGIRRSLEVQVLRGPEIHLRDSPAVVETILAENQSAALPGFDFVLSPEWDADDIAEYACSPYCLPSFRYRLVNRWLTPRAKFLLENEERETAIRALCRSFSPLVDLLVWLYRTRGNHVLGKDYKKLTREELVAWLPNLVDGFNYFWKEQQFVGGRKLDMPDQRSRLAASIYDDIEYPISAFLKTKLTEHLRNRLELPRRNPRRRRGPFRVAGWPELVCLSEDVQEELGISQTAVGKHRGAGHLTAWRIDHFRERLGLRPREPVELVPVDDCREKTMEDPERLELSVKKYYEEPPGELDGVEERFVSGDWIEPGHLRLKTEVYWVYAWCSVLDMHNHWNGRQYRYERPGPKPRRKTAVIPS
jgi:hypothetical protein